MGGGGENKWKIDQCGDNICDQNKAECVKFIEVEYCRAGETKCDKNKDYFKFFSKYIYFNFFRYI